MNTEKKIYAAPLQGLTEAVWRNAHYAVFGGADEYVTPFVRLEKGTFRNKDVRETDPRNNNAPVIPQIMASSAAEMEQIVDRLAGLGFTRMDVNMGCPFPLITAKGKGAGILRHPDRVEELCGVINRRDDILFSVKMRTGMESHDEWRSIIGMLNDTRLEMITMHPRTGRQQYKGEPSREAFGEFLAACRHKVIYNGDIKTAADAEEVMEMFPEAAGIMVGRGLVAMPWLAAEIRCGVCEDKATLYRKTLQMHDMIYDALASSLQGGDGQLLSKVKPMWEYLLPDLEKKARKAILKSNRTDRYLEAVRTACLG